SGRVVISTSIHFLATLPAMGFSVGETLASAVVKEAVNMIRVAAEREAGLLWSFKDDLGAMGDTLETIHAALRDAVAARGPAPDERTRLLLGRLKAAAQDIEDLLEEFADAGARGRRSNWLREVRVLPEIDMCASTNSEVAVSKVCNFVSKMSLSLILE
uniref:Disease resistance N-terminal domain-containing protein n=1 Tax=Aegilops tauschii subsp. strangulata TaxID=200361 RepID=A0A453QVC4_AEGTS